MSNTKLSVFHPILTYGEATPSNTCNFNHKQYTTSGFEIAYTQDKNVKDLYDKLGIMIYEDDPEYPLITNYIFPRADMFFGSRTAWNVNKANTFKASWNAGTTYTEECTHYRWDCRDSSPGCCDHHVRQGFNWRHEYGYHNGEFDKLTVSLFAFHDLNTAQKYIKRAIPITSMQYHGTTKYYTWDLNSIALLKNSVPNIYTDTNYDEYKTNFDAAINNCNEASDTYNTYYTNMYPGNPPVYKKKISDIRTENGLFKPSSPASAPSSSLSQLYSTKKGAMIPETADECYLNPNSKPWFDPAIYGDTPEQLKTAAENCKNLTTIIKKEAMDCCVNPNSVVSNQFVKCPDLYTPKQMYGCNAGTSVPQGGKTTITLGTDEQSETASKYAEIEGFTTIGEDIQTTNSIVNVQLGIINNTLKKIHSPEVQKSQANLSKSILSAQSNADIKTNLIGTKNSLNQILSYNDENKQASVVRKDIYTNNKTALQSINDCSNADSIVGVDESGDNYLTNNGSGCKNYNIAYNTALKSCNNAYTAATNVGDTEGQGKISQLKSNVSIGIIGQTMGNAKNTLQSLNNTCDSWNTLENIYAEDEARAAALPCVPTRPISNKFDNEISGIVDKWATESANYIKLLKQRLETIYDYVQHYPQELDIDVTYVPNGTPNTPFISLKQLDNDSTKPSNYNMNMYLPAGSKGESGAIGAFGPVGKMGSIGPDGSIGSKGIAELPNQYLPEN
jgi:hypothetical protein